MAVDIEFSADPQFEIEFDAGNQFEAEFGNAVEIQTSDYNELLHRPSITEPDFHRVVIEGDKSFGDYGLLPLDALDIIGVLS